MSGAPSVPQPRRFLGLLLCLIGVASVILSYFFLPLYVPPEGSEALTSWDWVSGQVSNMRILGVSSSFLFGIGWTLAPLVAAALVGVLGIARFAFPKPFLGVLYLVFCVLGSVVLGLTLIFVIYGLRLGALGEAVGYALCFWADYIWRGKRPARPPVWHELA